jgi:hypothetical protein
VKCTVPGIRAWAATWPSRLNFFDELERRVGAGK